MQVIAIDNFGRETVSDRVISTGLDPAEAEAKARQLNELHGGPSAQRHYVVKPDDYQPYVFQPCLAGDLP